jgi:hypothetical protein
MANIIKIKLVEDSGDKAASIKQLSYIEGLCGDAYRNEFLMFMCKRTTKEACGHITMIEATNWIKCLRFHLKWVLVEDNNI